jgi:hypothetical protein
MKVGRSKVLLYFKLLIEPGIREGIIGMRKHKYTHYLLRRMGTKLVQLTMSMESNAGISGSIQTIFLILVFSLTIAAFIFTIDLFVKKWRIRNGKTVEEHLEFRLEKVILKPNQ